jgi:hypothetical protein
VRYFYSLETDAAGAHVLQSNQRYFQHLSPDGRVAYYFSGAGNRERLYRVPTGDSSGGRTGVQPPNLSRRL